MVVEVAEAARADAFAEARVLVVRRGFTAAEDRGDVAAEVSTGAAVAPGAGVVPTVGTAAALLGGATTTWALMVGPALPARPRMLAGWRSCAT